MRREPDFERLKIALSGKQPDCVPLLELAIANSIKERYIGRPIADIKDNIDFFSQAGYDYVRVSPKINMNPENVRPKEGDRISSQTQQTSSREWHASGKGIITTMAEFEKFRWPQPDEVDYSNFELA
ncbi:MAG TPA: hypothetical protein ENN22_09405, partial [bacterium]|nr:hypothetical protein [bacterium]